MTSVTPSYSLFFTGTGSGGNPEPGASAACLERDGKPLLLIDCGPGTLNAYARRYQGDLPDALYITHAHLDHIADLEILSVRLRLAGKAAVPLFVPLNLIPVLHRRLATYPGTMAEGDHDFWQSFQLRPVTDQFIFGGETFVVHPTRHHAPGSSFALQIPGIMTYTGDTRPVPELLHHLTQSTEIIFHDCGTVANPSHTGLDDLEREYRADIRERLVLYHYADQKAATTLRSAGYTVADPGDVFHLTGDKGE